MDVWKALEMAKTSLDTKIRNLERAREGIRFEGAKAINLANMYTYFADVLSTIRDVLECLSAAKDTSAIKIGKGIATVSNSKWSIEIAGDKVILKRINPSLIITIAPEEVKISSRGKDEKELANYAIFRNSGFEVVRNKFKIAMNYNEYENILNSSYYIRYAFKPVAREVIKKCPALVQHLKAMNVIC